MGVHLFQKAVLNAVKNVAAVIFQWTIVSEKCII